MRATIKHAYMPLRSPSRGSRWVLAGKDEGPWSGNQVWTNAGLCILHSKLQPFSPPYYFSSNPVILTALFPGSARARISSSFPSTSVLYLTEIILDQQGILAYNFDGRSNTRTLNAILAGFRQITDSPPIPLLTTPSLRMPFRMDPEWHPQATPTNLAGEQIISCHIDVERI